MSIARLGAVASVAVALVLVALVMFGLGGSDYQVKAIFENASQLVNGNQVQIGGKAAGQITRIELNSDNQAEVTMKIDGEFAPLHSGTRATIRMTSLSGIANRSILVSPGPSSAPEIADGGTIDQTGTTSAVDLDQLFNTLDAKTREGFKRIIQQFAASYEGVAPQAGQAFRYMAPFLAANSRVMEELTADSETFRSLVVSSSRLLTALAERRTDLSELVHNAGITAKAIGRENQALAEALGLLPPTLRQANTTFVNLRGALDDLDPLIRDLKPTTDEQETLFRKLRPLVEESRPVIRDLRYAIRSSGSNNDLLEATRDMPKVERRASSAFKNTTTMLQGSQSMIDFIRSYSPDLTGFLTAIAGGAANYDASGHYLRAQPLFDNFKVEGGEYVPASDAERLALMQKDVVRRCPGGATQPAPDGSNPFDDSSTLDCDPSLTPPGP